MKHMTLNELNYTSETLTFSSDMTQAMRNTGLPYTLLAREFTSSF